eukprot:TRINITY_DN2999_c0_g1_i3.p1 TRINITY_DN2999_c0_g1~~TRINITY_DN2999_c0_g1_i3.p1  ORF type:complete len:291 (-),score=110.35 TRINITY_DN2999_c0_g1_i3:75-947(-)
MFWGCILTEKHPYTFPEDPTWKIVNITNASLSRSSAEGKTHLRLTNENETITLAALQKDKLENYRMTLKVVAMPDVKLSVVGKGEVHVTGYFEPTGEGEFDMEEEELKQFEEIEESEENSEEEPVMLKPEKEIPPKKTGKKLETKKQEQKKSEPKGAEQKQPEHKKPEQRKQEGKKQEQKKPEALKTDQKKQEQKKPKVEDIDSDSESEEKYGTGFIEGLDNISDEDDSEDIIKPSKGTAKVEAGKKRASEQPAPELKKKPKHEAPTEKPKERPKEKPAEGKKKKKKAKK